MKSLLPMRVEADPLAAIKVGMIANQIIKKTTIKTKNGKMMEKRKRYE